MQQILNKDSHFESPHDIGVPVSADIATCICLLVFFIGRFGLISMIQVTTFVQPPYCTSTVTQVRKNRDSLHVSLS